MRATAPRAFFVRGRISSGLRAVSVSVFKRISKDNEYKYNLSYIVYGILHAVRGQAPGRIQSLRAFRRSAPRLSVVGRCLDFKAVGLFGELLYCPGHQLTSEAHRRWSHRGTAKSHRSGAICCRCACSWVRPRVPKSMFIRAGGHADKQPLDRIRGIWEIPP